MTPDPKHVEAVAALVADRAALSLVEGEWVAEILLTSTDPAVLDAMQDALVRAGRLRDDERFGVPFDGGVAIADPPRRPWHREYRRLVSEWQEVPDE